MKEELKGWISYYGTQMVPKYTVGSTNRLNHVTVSDVANYVVDHNATDTMAETAAKSLMDTFLQMGTKSGG